MTTPLVSCLMVTRNRANLARRAVECLAHQTWPTKELVIIDDGEEDYEPMLAPYRDALAIDYHRMAPRPGELFLGGLRNLSLERAQGGFCIQWDDDEWYHPDRITAQMSVLSQGMDGSVLSGTLMHMDAPESSTHLYRAYLKRGVPGTVLHKRCGVRYPNLPKSEDSVYLTQLRRELKIGILGEAYLHLFIRCFHGTNTWDARHFTKRLHRTWRDTLHYAIARYLKGDIFQHPAFELNATEADAAERFLRESRALGLLKH